MGFALTPGEAPLHFSRSKNVMHVAFLLRTIRCDIMTDMASRRKTLKRDWFDNQPGAWVMVMLPAAAEEGALAVGQCRVGHGHGDRVVWQRC